MTPAVLTKLTGGVLATSAGAFLSQVAGAGPTTSNVVTVTSGGATAAAVGALVYIARLMGKGELVAKNTAEAEKQAAEERASLVEANRQLVEMVKQAQKREDWFYKLIVQGEPPPPRE